MEAIAADHNQYAITWGVKSFRDAIAKKTMWFLGSRSRPRDRDNRHVRLDRGNDRRDDGYGRPVEEVDVFEPFYENYAPDAILSDATPKHVPLYRTTTTDLHFDREELRSAFNERTKAIIICNPNNPTGKVFTKDELEFIADLCKEFDALAFTDEIYEHIIYPTATADDDPLTHISMANIDGMRERTVVVNSMSKTYSVTGWRVGYCIAPPDITSAIRKVHDFLTVGAANPLQHAGAYALSLPASYYDELQSEYQKKRDFIVPVLQNAGFQMRLSRRRILCDVRYFRLRFRQRHRVHKTPHP